MTKQSSERVRERGLKFEDASLLELKRRITARENNCLPEAGKTANKTLPKPQDET